MQLFECKFSLRSPLLSATQRLSYGDCLEVIREYYQNCSVPNCVTQCSQSATRLYEQFLQVHQIGFVTLGPLGCAYQRQLTRVVLLQHGGVALIGFKPDFGNQLDSFSALTLLVWSSGP